MLKKVLLSALSVMLVSVTTLSVTQTHNSAHQAEINQPSSVATTVSTSEVSQTQVVTEESTTTPSTTEKKTETETSQKTTITKTVITTKATKPETTKSTTAATTKSTTSTSNYKKAMQEIPARKIVWEDDTQATTTTKSVTQSSTKTTATYSAAYFKNAGVIYWGGYRWTWYSQRILPGQGLVIPGRHVDSNGYVCDANDNICLASSTLPKGTVVSTPFGKQGKVYDCGCAVGTLDVYTNF